MDGLVGLGMGVWAILGIVVVIAIVYAITTKRRK